MGLIWPSGPRVSGRPGVPVPIAFWNSLLPVFGVICVWFDPFSRGGALHDGLV